MPRFNRGIQKTLNLLDSRLTGCCNKVFLASFRTLRSVSFRAKRGILSFRSGQAPGEILFLLTSPCFKIPRSPSAPRNDSFPSFCNSLVGGNPESKELDSGSSILRSSATAEDGSPEWQIKDEKLCGCYSVCHVLPVICKFVFLEFPEEFNDVIPEKEKPKNNQYWDNKNSRCLINFTMHCYFGCLYRYLVKGF